MTRILTIAFAALFAVGLGGCSLFGVDPVDSEDARVKVERIVATAQFANELASVVVSKHAARCEADPAAKLCDKPELTAAIVSAQTALSVRLAELRALVDAGSTEAEQLAGAVDLVFAAIDDVTAILAAYNTAA